ncbi:MAG: OmpA family protein [Alphaproteobacteria bacterium PRO2]|nr:OmpA family protein [Alphaproteobacteria bacterium PRO2]
MNILRNVILVTGMVALSGCTAFTSFSEVEALNDAQPVGSPFTQALTGEYRQFSNSEKDNFDYPDALHFARKGLAAASGETVLPEPVADWNLSEKHIQELGAARGRLIVAYDLGARETAPALSARAQAKFDCWIESQEEHWNDTDVPCKKDFMDALAQLEGQLQPQAPVQDVVEPMNNYGVDPNAPMAAENAMYLVFFDWDRSNIGSGAQSVLDAVAAEVAKNPPASISVVGHADTSGPTDYNERLALKRANNVKDALVQRGVDASIIMVDAKGESEPLVATPDNVREPANRRVNISFQ